MEIFYPMVISAVAVLATLIYTSYLDIRDRRVPFIHWLPMLAVGAICTSVLLWQTTANASLVTGYLALVASFLYADYLDNRGRTDSLGLTGYYAKSRMFWYLIPVIALPGALVVRAHAIGEHPAHPLVRDVCRHLCLCHLHGIQGVSRRRRPGRSRSGRARSRRQRT